VWGLLVVAANLRASLTGVGPLLDRVQADLELAPAVAGLLNTVPFASVRGNISDGSATGRRWQPERLSGRARGADARDRDPVGTDGNQPVRGNRANRAGIAVAT